MRDIAKGLAENLEALGVQVELLNEHASIESRPPICLYVAPQEFFGLEKGKEWVREDVLAEAFVYSTEQLQGEWFKYGLPFMLLSKGVVDLCPQSAVWFEQVMPSVHMLPSVSPGAEKPAARTREHPLFKVLPAAAQIDPVRELTWDERPIDVSFFAYGVPRRDKFFLQNAEFFAELETFIYSRRIHEIMIESGRDGALSAVASQACAFSKIMLNIHRDDYGFFEWHRLVHLAMRTGSLVVTEPCMPQEQFKPGVHYLEEKRAQIPSLIDWLLHDPAGIERAKEITKNATELLRTSYDRNESGIRLLNFLMQHAGGDA
jgi:hypothetical protein